MSLRHALLGILSYHPMTGYELKQFFDSSVQHFWNAELSQIYPTLKTMEAEGLVEMHVEVQDNRPNRKVYEITDAGHGELETWLRVPIGPASIRDAFLIKVFFSHYISREDVLILFRRHMEEQQKLLAFSETVLRDRIRAGARNMADARPSQFWSLTLDLAIAYRKAYIEWCAHAIEVLEREDGAAEDLDTPLAVPDVNVGRFIREGMASRRKS